LEFIALSCSSEDLFVKLLGLFFGYLHFHAGPCCRPRKYRLDVDLIVRKLLFYSNTAITTYFMNQTSTINSVDTGLIYAVLKLAFSKQYKI